MVGTPASRAGPTTADRAKSFYQVFDLPQCSPLEGIKRRYKELALRLHPDKNLTDPQAVERFQELNMAYEALSNPAKKKLLDDALVLAQTALSPPDSLQTAAALFRKQHSNFHDDLQLFRQQRRARSQSSRQQTGGASDRPSQYTKEQTEFFRQREKEREKEMVRRLERERDQQRELELEKYRVAQEERMKDEEKRAREARNKLDRAEAALSARGMTMSASGASPQGSFRLARRDGNVAGNTSSRSASCDASSPSYGPSAGVKLTSPLTPRPAAAGGGGGSQGSSTPRSALKSNATASPTVDSYRMRSPPGDASPLGDPAQPLSTRMRKERERQDDIRRAEQERYLHRKLMDIRMREEHRAQEAAIEERRIYERELLLLIENENGERKHFLEQEEELERRLLTTTFRRVEDRMHAHTRVVQVRRDEAYLRHACHDHEASERAVLCVLADHMVGAVQVLYAQHAERQVLVDGIATTLRAMQQHQLSVAQLRSAELCARDVVGQAFVKGVRCLHLSCIVEPAHRTLQREQAMSAMEQLGHTWGLTVGVVGNEALLRQVVLEAERTDRGHMRLHAAEVHRRHIVQAMEVDGFVHVQRCKGLHLQQMWQSTRREHQSEVELARMQHDAEVSRLLHELSQLHQQLDAARQHPSQADGSRGNAKTLSAPAGPYVEENRSPLSVDSESYPLDHSHNSPYTVGSSKRLLYPPLLPAATPPCAATSTAEPHATSLSPLSASTASSPSAAAMRLTLPQQRASEERENAMIGSERQRSTSGTAWHPASASSSTSSGGSVLVSTPLLRSKTWGAKAVAPPPGVVRRATVADGAVAGNAQ